MINMANTTKKLVNLPEVVVEICGRPYNYFMTDSKILMNGRLAQIGCRELRPIDLRLNPNLSTAVRDKMAEVGAKYSLTLSNGVAVLNYYRQGKTPFIVFLNELLDPWRKVAGEGKTISLFQQLQDMVSMFMNPSVQMYWPPLMNAVNREDLDAARFLLEAGSAPDDHTEEGLNALMVAVIKNNKELVQLLLKNKAEVNAMTSNGWTPLRFATFMYFYDKKDRTEIIEILKKAGARSDLKGLPYLFIWRRMTFHEKLNAYIWWITRNGLCKESDIYKRCKMDKRTYWKIRNNKNPNYHPKKNSVLQLIIGLGLALREAEDLLATAGYSFIHKDEFDAIIKRHIQVGDCDMTRIEDELYEKTGKTLCFYEK